MIVIEVKAAFANCYYLRIGNQRRKLVKLGLLASKMLRFVRMKPN